MFVAFVMRVVTLLPLFFALFPTLSLARTVVVAPSDTKSIKYVGAGFTFARAAAGGSAGTQSCPDISSAAVASVPGASFSFTFNGTTVSLSTRTGPGEASFRVTSPEDVRDVNPADLGSHSCFLSYSSPILAYGEHTITVTVTNPGTMALLSIAYETGNEPVEPVEEKKPLNTTVTVIIAVCCVAGFLAIFATVFFLCCRRTRRAKGDVETASLRYKNKGQGLLTTTPTFVQYPAERKDSTYHFSDDVKASPSDRSASPKPSTVQPYRPYSPPRQPLPVYGVQMQHTRTTGATETAFSV